MNLSVVIPSKNADNLVRSLDAVARHEPDVRVIVVDDGLNLAQLAGDERTECLFSPASRSVLVPGVKPFVYARNCNVGIRAAGDDDVVLLNDDALLETPGGFSAMQAAAAADPRIGIVGSSCNNVGNPNQWNKGTGGLRPENRMVCFACVLLPRRTIERVGLLDERYVGYGMDDDDYCWSVRTAGLRIAVHDGCFVDHKSLQSSYRGDPRTPADFIPNLQRFRAKWGHDNWGHR